jgi:hypothetical protein
MEDQRKVEMSRASGLGSQVLVAKVRDKVN